MIPDNPHIQGAFFKAIGYLDESKNILVSCSGGSDSDVVIDFLHQCGFGDKVEYVFFDTGLEYQATKDHLDYLEDKYDIQIDRAKAFKSIPYCCKTYGEPFINKIVSENIERLQRHGFQWEDEPYDVLIKRYPDAQCGLKWWCNHHEINQYCIRYKKYLKEFLIENPPKFKISPKCCRYAKKMTAKKYYKDHNVELSITGMRKSEGGIRATALKSCYSIGSPDSYRPIWWFTNQDKKEYCQHYNVIHSKAYTKYGFSRTGCACCPFAFDLQSELRTISKYEPRLFKAIINTFEKTYEYTRQYYDFRDNLEKEVFRQNHKTRRIEEWCE